MPGVADHPRRALCVGQAEVQQVHMGAARASTSDTARPMPDAAPVTTAVLSASENGTLAMLKFFGLLCFRF